MIAAANNEFTTTFVRTHRNGEKRRGRLTLLYQNRRIVQAFCLSAAVFLVFSQGIVSGQTHLIVLEGFLPRRLPE